MIDLKTKSGTLSKTINCFDTTSPKKKRAKSNGRAFVFLWENEPGKFIFESAGERKHHNENSTPEDICRDRLRDNKKIFDWSSIPIHYIEITDWIANYTFPSNTKDPITWTENSILRKVIESEGFTQFKGSDGKRSEIHLLNNKTIKDVLDVLNNYLFGLKNPIDFKPKKRTTLKLLKQLELLNTGKVNYKEFLYGVATGGGKTSDFLFAGQHWKKLTGCNTHICVTSMPDTRKDLCRDVAQGLQFQDIIVWVPDKAIGDVKYMLGERVMPFSQLDLLEQFPKHNHVISLGVQDARGDNGEKYKHILEKFNFGMYGKDEVHTNQGEFSVFATKVETYLNFDLALYMTGTPEQFVLEYSKFTEDNRLLFLMADVYKAMKEGDPDWQNVPWRNIMVLDYEGAQQAVAKSLGLEVEQFVTLPKQWAWDKTNDILVHDNAINKLLEMRLGIGLYADSPRCFWGPGSGLSKYRKKTGVICIENGDTNKKTIYLKNKIETITNGNIKCFSAHEPTGYDNWLNYCNNNDGDSIYITHDKDMTGKNNPWINWGWFSLNMNSVVRANQGLGRFVRKLLNEAGKNLKPDIYVFFDNPETALTVNLDPLEAVSNTPGATYEVAKEIRTISTYWLEGSEGYVEAKEPDLVEYINRIDPLGSRSLNSSRHISQDITCPEHLKGNLKNTTTPKSAKQNLSNIEVTKGKNKVVSRNGDAETNEDKVYRNNLQTSIKKLAKAIIFTDGEFYSLEKILKNPMVEKDGVYFTIEQLCQTPLAFSDISEEVENGNLNVKSINRALANVRFKFLDAKNIDVVQMLDMLETLELHDNSNQFIPENSELANQIVTQSLQRTKLDCNSLIIDTCGGRGLFIICLLRKAKELNIDIDTKKVYYNDIDPVMVAFFRKINKDQKLGIPEKNITCGDALDLEYDMKFDFSITNVAYNSREDSYTGDVAVSGGKMGTVGDKNIGKKLNKKARDIVKDGGTAVQMGLKGAMLDEVTNDPNFNPELVSLMVDRDWWKYNTFYVIGKKEKNKKQYKLYTGDINSDIVSKIFKKKDFNFTIQQDSYSQLKDKGLISDTDTGNPLCIVRNKKKEDMNIIRAYPSDKGQKRVINGPKFMHYMAESAVTWLATNEPVLCDCAVVFPTDNLEQAEKMKLFTQNNPLLKFVWKTMKLKGQDQFWQFCKKFDLDQIVTGYEYPSEYNLTSEEKKYLDEKFRRN